MIWLPIFHTVTLQWMIVIIPLWLWLISKNPNRLFPQRNQHYTRCKQELSLPSESSNALLSKMGFTGWPSSFATINIFLHNRISNHNSRSCYMTRIWILHVAIPIASEFWQPHLLSYIVIIATHCVSLCVIIRHWVPPCLEGKTPLNWQGRLCFHPNSTFCDAFVFYSKHIYNPTNMRNLYPQANSPKS